MLEVSSKACPHLETHEANLGYEELDLGMGEHVLLVHPTELYSHSNINIYLSDFILLWLWYCSISLKRAMAKKFPNIDKATHFTKESDANQV